MSSVQCRGLIALAAVLVALLWPSRPAEAQSPISVDDPGPPRESTGWFKSTVIGVEYDIANQVVAEWHLRRLEAKLRRDTERGNRAAVDRDIRCIEIYKNRIAVDEWLIRKNSLRYPGDYPHSIHLDPVSLAAIAQYARPLQGPDPLQPVPPPGPMAPTPTPALTPTSTPSQPVPPSGPMAAAPTVTITIVNAEPSGPGVAFAIDGVTHQSIGGSRQDFDVVPDSTITYDGGGSLGERRYRLSSGVYEFRSTPEGWALYKLPSTP